MNFVPGHDRWLEPQEPILTEEDLAEIKDEACDKAKNLLDELASDLDDLGSDYHEAFLNEIGDWLEGEWNAIKAAKERRKRRNRRTA